MQKLNLPQSTNSQNSVADIDLEIYSYESSGSIAKAFDFWNNMNEKNDLPLLKNLTKSLVCYVVKQVYIQVKVSFNIQVVWLGPQEIG